MDTWDYTIFWKETLNQFKNELSEQEFAMWFNMEYESSSEACVHISVPSAFYRDQVRQRYFSRIENALFDLSGQHISVDISVKPRNKQVNSSTPMIPESEKNFDLNSHSEFKESAKLIIPEKTTRGQHPNLRADYLFDNFVIGENNTFAANAAMAVSSNPGRSYNPYLIYGGVGLGKTHLMQAIGNRAWKESGCKIIYITAENFMNDFISALNTGKTAEFKNRYRKVDILMIDDIHFLQKKMETQEELFHTFNSLYEVNKQIIFTCDRPVSELKNLTDRLRSRFERGLSVDLQPPNFETRCAILLKKMEANSVKIPENVIHLIAKNISSNVRDLEASLTKLIAFSDLTNRVITIEIAQQQLRDSFGAPKQNNVTIETIQKVVAEYFSLSYTDLKGKKRTKAISFPRHLAMFIARELTEYSTTELGIEFGGRDHTTVMHGCQKIEEKLKADPSISTIIQKIHNMIKDYRS